MSQPLSAIVRRYVDLRRCGREHIGLSPFRQERTPSFTVEHGDAKTFVRRMRELGIAERGVAA